MATKAWAWRAGARARIGIGLFLTLAAGTAAGASAEWTSWRGPQQDGSSPESPLISTWSVQGENLIWRTDFTGRATPLVFDGRVCVNGRVGEAVDMQERVACFDAATGKALWERRFNVYHTSNPYPRLGWANLLGDPETGYLYAHMGGGKLLCLDESGKTVWSKALTEDFGRFSGYGGRTQTPVLEGEQVILGFVSSSWGPMGPPRHRYYSFHKRNGQVLWIATPGGPFANPTPYSTPVVATVKGQRLMIGGNADGAIYALNAGTGKTVWKFQLGKRGLHSSVVVHGERVFAGHGEENIDEGTMGRVVCIDATGSGDVTATHEVWRVNELKAGYTSPLYHGGRLYVVDDSANMHALDAGTGKVLWEYSLGTVGKGSPVWGDGKIFAPEVNGNFHILKPGDDGVISLDREHLVMADGRYAEIYASPAIAYGRVYLVSEEGLYCLGDKEQPFSAEGTGPRPAPAAGQGEPATIHVVPGEIDLGPGETVSFQIRAFDDKGRSLGTVDGEWSLKGLRGTLESGRFAPDAAAGSQAGVVQAAAGDLQASARVRVFTSLPWSQDFEALEEGARLSTWIGAGTRFAVEDRDGGKVLAKAPAPSGLQRSRVFVGPAEMSNYMVQADVMGVKTGRRRGDVGIINNGYTLDLMGNHQRLQVRSWISELRMAETVDFAWEPEVWYTMKLQVERQGDKAIIKGKVWPREAEEPAAWTITATDPHPIETGSPGLYGHSLASVYLDNLKITPNSR